MDIVNNVIGTTFVQRTALKDFQGKLKKIDPKKNKELQNNIMNRGYDAPIYLWHNNDNLILDGHQRLKALNELAAQGNMLPGDNIPIIYIVANSLKEAKEKVLEYNSKFSDFDTSELYSFTEGLDLDGILIDGLKKKRTDKDDKEDEVPEVLTPPIVQIGDIFQVGKHRIACIDCTNKEQVSMLMDGKDADCVWTDPPYNVNYSGKGKNTSNGIKNDNMGDQAFQYFLDNVFESYSGIIKKGAAMYVFHSPSTQDQFMDSIERNGFDIKCQLIRNKPSINHIGGDYHQKHEPFFYCGVKGSKPQRYGDIFQKTVIDRHNKTDEEILKIIHSSINAEKNGKTTIWSIRRHNVQDYIHPTQKPVELVELALENSSKEGDIIVDFFLGSGTCLIGCEKTDRVCYGCDLDPHYIEVILKRYALYSENKNEIQCLNRDLDINCILDGQRLNL